MTCRLCAVLEHLLVLLKESKRLQREEYDRLMALVDEERKEREETCSGS